MVTFSSKWYLYKKQSDMNFKRTNSIEKSSNGVANNVSSNPGKKTIQLQPTTVRKLPNKGPGNHGHKLFDHLFPVMANIAHFSTDREFIQWSSVNTLANEATVDRRQSIIARRQLRVTRNVLTRIANTGYNATMPISRPRFAITKRHVIVVLRHFITNLVQILNHHQNTNSGRYHLPPSRPKIDPMD